MAGEHLDTSAIREQRRVHVDDPPGKRLKKRRGRGSASSQRGRSDRARMRESPSASRRSYACAHEGSRRSASGSDTVATPAAAARCSAPASARSLTTTATSASSVPHAIASSSACRFVPEPEARTAIRGTRMCSFTFELTLVGIPGTSRCRGAAACRRTGSCPPPRRHVPPPPSDRRPSRRPRALGRRS